MNTRVMVPLYWPLGHGDVARLRMVANQSAELVPVLALDIQFRKRNIHAQCLLRAVEAMPMTEASVDSSITILHRTTHKSAPAWEVARRSPSWQQ
jgi:hypothetical protein